MICQKCKREISDSYAYCPSCGTKQKIRGRICPKCGLIALPMDKKCDGCGYSFFKEEKSSEESSSSDEADNELDEENEESKSSMDGYEDISKKCKAFIKKYKKGIFLTIMVVLFTILMVYMLFAAIKSIGKTDTVSTDKVKMKVIENPSKAELPADMYNLYENRFADIRGVLATDNGRCILRLDEPISVFSATSDAKKNVLIRNVTEIGFKYNNAAVREEELEALPDDTKLRIRGNLSVFEKAVFIFPDAFRVLEQEQNAEQPQGTTSAQNAGSYEKKQSENSQGETSVSKTIVSGSTADYILPYSSERKLSLEELSQLDLQQLNYAKNEIYARHGRRFHSAELQQYFEGKSWYVGKIDPDAFSEDSLTATEIANIELLREREYTLNVAGYSLK